MSGFYSAESDDANVSCGSLPLRLSPSLSSRPCLPTDVGRQRHVGTARDILRKSMNMNVLTDDPEFTFSVL